MAEPWWVKHKVSLPEGQVGDVRVEHFTITDAGSDLFNITAGSRYVTPGDYTKLYVGDVLMMSDTRAEISDHHPVLIRLLEPTCKRVLIHGLGIGMIVQAALAQPHVEHVDVVELSQDVIDLVAPHYADPRLHVHQGDAFTYKFPPKTVWDVVWHDIWPTLCSDDLEEHAKLSRRYGRASAWQGCWGHGALLDYRQVGF